MTRMSWQTGRLIVAGLAFTLWSAWLGWQVWRHPAPTLVSQPQLLVAPVVVVAELSAPAEGQPATAKVREVLKGGGFLPADQTVRLLDWNQAAGFRGPGTYLLPLQPIDRAQGRFSVVPVPVSPGHYYLNAKDVKRKVYPLTPSVELQARELLQGA